MTTESRPPLLTLRQVAEVLQVPYEIVRTNVYSGKWPHVKISQRNRRMTDEQVDEVIEMASHTPAPSTRADARKRRDNIRSMLKAI
ncbi:hypothetical protein [Microbacterium suaedae]|uniref:hypothetical protein n=1 Tax=Microbacterium suaedae TaxID=2067813 RepID=UPI000DADC47B|nr:hypothetical protein [Microbacterium suaedae]